MPTKLKNLKVKRVALVDEGANPDAHVKFAKSKSGPQDEITADEAISFAQRFSAFVGKIFGGHNNIEKGAFTFSEGEAKRDYERVIDCEIYPMLWAFMDSVRSILTDTEKGDSDKESLFKQSFAEFSDAFGKAIPNWATGAENNIDVQKDTDALVKMRDHLSEMIEKSADEDDDPDSPDNNTGNEPDNGGEGQPPVMKGAIDMKFDTEKMTPEERERYEDLAKRYGHEDGEEGSSPAAPSPSTPPAPAAPADDGDIYKGLHPTVKAELENLRKFREESEDRQYLEVAKRYSLLGKKPEELAPVLKSLKAAGGSAYDDMIGILDANLAAVEKSGVFSEIGKRGGDSATGDDAWGKIETAAQEIVKSKPGMRWADAVDAACCAHPELVQEYEKSRK